MSTTPSSAKQHLAAEITTALDEGATAKDLVELIVRSGWQPRPVPDPNSDYFEGLLDDGRRVPIEIRHASLSHAG
jgi:hypothetical protein